jgi:hypothetical protein
MFPVVKNADLSDVGDPNLVFMFQRRAFVHRNVHGLVAFDLVLWIILGRMMRVPFVFNIVFVDLYNSAADLSRL